MKRFRRVAVTVVGMAGMLSLAPPGSSAQTLPDQASPVAFEHTHGPDGVELDRRGRPSAAEPYDVDRHAPWNTKEYDGQAFVADQLDGARDGKAMFHAIYVYPSDKKSRFGSFAAMFQADARDASRLLESLYGRAIRFDERPAASASMIQTPVLDITVFKSRYSSRQLAGTNQFNLVNDELRAKFNAPNKKYMAWLDAGSQYCGQGNLSHDDRRQFDNQNQGRTLAIVYRPYAMTDAATGGFCRGRTLRHELGHTMGALQVAAPSSFDNAHCDDSAEDTMCYVSGTSVDPGFADFDFKNDDYWDPLGNDKFAQPYPGTAPGGKLGWWTVNLSAYLCDTPGSCDDAALKPALQY